MKIITSNQFIKDLKLIKKRGYDLNELSVVVELIKNNTELPKKYKNHILQGKFNKFYECHIKPDWLLIYKVDLENQIYLIRTGTHSDLFE